MKRIAKVFGPILIVAGRAACGASTPQSAAEHRNQCWRGGIECRWDNQCCSGRCYVDTGCMG
jgi:hypothetical protein